MSDTKSQFPEAQRTHAGLIPEPYIQAYHFQTTPKKLKKNSERSQRGENILPIKEQR